jgi:hypothetical protein
VRAALGQRKPIVGTPVAGFSEERAPRSESLALDRLRKSKEATIMVMQDEIELEKQWFRARLAGEKTKMDVIAKVKEGKGDFVLLDARDRASFERGHLPGALSSPLDEVERVAGTLDHDKEYVVYCWNAT